MDCAEEQAPFLSKSFDSIDDETGRPRSRSAKRHPNALLVISLLANAVLLVVSLAMIAMVFASRHNGSTLIEEPYSPASSVIEYENRMMTMNDTRFLGRPGPAWEQSMGDLLQGTLIRISRDELELADSESVSLKDGGYAAGLGVAHNLHCVKKLKQFLYFRDVYPDIEVGGAQHNHIQTHADHCLDFIRQSIMCHLDFSLYTLVWGPGINGTTVLDHRLPGMQKCVNWEKLHDWMQSRSTSTEMLVTPDGLL